MLLVFSLILVSFVRLYIQFLSQVSSNESSQFLPNIITSARIEIDGYISRNQYRGGKALNY